ncbi:hypothetical protein MN608_05225 [Microdochium nivale]|nr:hypothetical protein MN608_05225 [Microdochium nivale]
MPNLDFWGSCGSEEASLLCSRRTGRHTALEVSVLAVLAVLAVIHSSADTSSRGLAKRPLGLATGSSSSSMQGVKDQSVRHARRQEQAQAQAHLRGAAALSSTRRPP